MSDGLGKESLGPLLPSATGYYMLPCVLRGGKIVLWRRERTREESRLDTNALFVYARVFNASRYSSKELADILKLQEQEQKQRPATKLVNMHEMCVWTAAVDSTMPAEEKRQMVDAAMLLLATRHGLDFVDISGREDVYYGGSNGRRFR